MGQVTDYDGKVFVLVVHQWYNDIPVKVFTTLELANTYMDDHVLTHPDHNYEVKELELIKELD